MLTNYSWGRAFIFPNHFKLHQMMKELFTVTIHPRCILTCFLKRQVNVRHSQMVNRDLCCRQRMPVVAIVISFHI